MRREICLCGNPPKHIAVLEDGRLCEWIPADEQQDTGAVILGKVERIMPGLNAAFVEIGQEKAGFLPLEEKSKTWQGRRLASGDRILVQIRREAHGDKGAFLSRDISLAGEYLILMPCNRYIGVSGRITGETSERLREIGSGLSDGRFGLVMRTASENAELSLLREEAEALWHQWQKIEKESAAAKAPLLLLSGCQALDEAVRDYRHLGIDAVSETEEEAVRPQISQALNRKVQLKSGANLVIDECEALTVIDVNTASFSGGRAQADTIRLVNEEACGEIVRQIRLRNLSGIILIDMMDMDAEQDRDAVAASLQKELMKDRRKTVLHGFTSLGLIELTRKRSGRTLREQLCTPCMHCSGSGWRRSADTAERNMDDGEKQTLPDGGRA